MAVFLFVFSFICWNDGRTELSGYCGCCVFVKNVKSRVMIYLRKPGHKSHHAQPPADSICINSPPPPPPSFYTHLESKMND